MTGIPSMDTTYAAPAACVGDGCSNGLHARAKEAGTTPVLCKFGRNLLPELMIRGDTYMSGIKRLVSSPILVTPTPEFLPHHGFTRLLDVAPIPVNFATALAPHILMCMANFTKKEHIINIPMYPTHDPGRVCVLISLGKAVV
jgi:hypothetical protein